MWFKQRLDEMMSSIIILTLLRVFSDPNFSRGAHRIDASVSVTGVGAFIWRLYVIQDQAAIGWQQDVTPVWTHRHTISKGEEDKDKSQLRLISF